MHRKIVVSLVALALCVPAFASDAVFIDLGPSQSMGISGKGKGQDAAKNPYLDRDSTARIENVGKNPFSIRIQQNGKVLKNIRIAPDERKAVRLLQGHELYFDSKLKTRVKIEFTLEPPTEP